MSTDENLLENYLRSRRPKAMEKLKTQFPDEYPSGPIALDNVEEIAVGTRGMNTSTPTTYRTELAMAALSTALSDAKDVLPKMKSKLSRLKNLSLFSKIITALTGVAMLGTLAENYTSVSYFLAGLTFAVSVMDLIVSHQRSGLFGQGQGLEETYSSLVDHRWEAESLLDQLKVIKEFPDSNANVQDIFEKSKSLIFKLQTTIDNYI